MADQHGIGFVRVQRAVGFIDEVVALEHCATAENQRYVEMQRLRGHRSDRIALIVFACVVHAGPEMQKPVQL